MGPPQRRGFVILVRPTCGFVKSALYNNRGRCDAAPTVRPPGLEENALPYLRFTPQEYRAICRACRSTNLPDEFFDAFQHFLVDALLQAWPELAAGLSRLDPVHLHLLFEHLQLRKAREA